MEHQKLSPKFFFLSLGVLVSLIASVTSFLSLVFATLDKKFPDALNAVYTYGYNTYDFAAMRSALATLIIIFPVFLILSYFWTKAIRGELGRIDTVIKKWMLYLIIFLASVVIIVDLITLVNYFVQGEITSRFIYKVIAVLVVAKLTGLYYLYELRMHAGRSWKRIAAAGIGAVLVIIAIGYSFSIMGSPTTQRLLRLDDRRVQDLQSIQWQVISYWQQKEKLPEVLKDLADPISSYALPVDPEFQKGMTYEYKKTGDMSFELCATFAKPIPQGWRENPSYGYGGGVMPMARPMMEDMSDAVVSSPGYPGSGVNDSWDHDAGRTCFERTIDKDIYPPYPKPLAR